jgi:death-on-curing protein
VIQEPFWLTIENLLQINQRVVEQTKEPFCVLNPGLLDGARTRPINHYLYGNEEDIVVLACKLLFGVAHNHPFQQGNKRTGFHGAILFMRWNGYTLASPPNDEIVGRWITAVLQNQDTEPNFAGAIRRLVVETM